MKRFLIALMAMVAVISVKAATVIASLGDPSATITYQSVDVDNNPITLSAKLYWTSKKTVNFVMINCHATITHNDGCPTGETPQMEAVKFMTTEDCLLVCPDYIGFSGEDGSEESKSKVHPYMCSTLTGRNVLDAYKAAIKYVKEKENLTISDKYYTINVGYSQGGATALGFQRYLETEATDADRAFVNLRGSVCGAGPYNQNTVFDVYEKGEGKFETLDYPIYLLYTLNGHKNAFGKSIMRKLELEECFTPEFWAYCQNGFMDKLNAKVLNVDQLNDELKSAGFNTFYSIINAAYADRNSKVYRTIRKALEQSNLLAEGWTPSKDIIFYHDHAGNDIVVPYQCTADALERFVGHCSYVDAVDDYDYTWSATGSVKDNYLWHAAVFREIWKSMWTYPGQNTIIALAGITGNESYNFNQLDHRTFGARFYAQFLAERKIMRPEKNNPASTGTAHNTNLDPETPIAVAVAATEASVAGTADRVEMALPYAMIPGTQTFLQFPATLDGYYFGCDAERYEVTLNADGEAVAYTKMDDLADFEAGKVYLVTSEDADEEITIVSPAQKKEVAACDLAWRELNMRKANTVDGTSYVSNCMPFAYRPVDATAYAMTQSATQGKVHPVAFTDAVPAGVGTLVEKEDAASIVILAPAMDSNGEAVEGNLLTGNYTQIANDKENYLHFGLSNLGNLGFWVYPNKETVRPYSAYIDLTGRSLAKGLELDNLGEETDGITVVNDNDDDNDNCMYNVAGLRVSENAKGIIIKNGKKVLVK